MNKKFSAIIALFLGLGIFFGSCSDDDKDQVSEEWIAYQKNWVADVIKKEDKTGGKIYTALKSDLGEEKYVYHRPSDFITNNLDGKFGKLPEAFPEVDIAKGAEKKEVIEEIKYDTDIAVTRYHGWFYSLEGKKVIFDSTETDSYGNSLNNGGVAANFTVGGLTDGFKTALYNMKVGDERIVCIPHDLAYGTYGNSTGTIPGYTTLFFDIKLMEVKR